MLDKWRNNTIGLIYKTKSDTQHDSNNHDIKLISYFMKLWTGVNEH